MSAMTTEATTITTTAKRRPRVCVCVCVCKMSHVRFYSLKQFIYMKKCAVGTVMLNNHTRARTNTQTYQ